MERVREGYGKGERMGERGKRKEGSQGRKPPSLGPFSKNPRSASEYF